jgi:hypothetical protein
MNCSFKVKESGKEGKQVGKLAVTGENPAKINANQLELKVAGGPDCTPLFLPATQSFWSAEYEVTEPNPLFVQQIA